MTRLRFSPFPNIMTENLCLRQVQFDDYNEIFILKSDERVIKYLDRPRAESTDEARQFIQKINDGILMKEWIFWGITLKDSSRLLGTICLWNICETAAKADIGYELLPDFQGRGIMREAVQAVLKYGFEKMLLKSVEAVVDAENKRSVRLLERNGFKYKGSFKEKRITENGYSTMLVYELINPDMKDKKWR